MKLFKVVKNDRSIKIKRVVRVECESEWNVISIFPLNRL